MAMSGDNFEIKQEGNIIFVSVNSLFDDQKQAENFHQQSEQIIEGINSILDQNPDKKFNVLGEIEGENISRNIGDLKDNVQEMINNPQLEKIAIAVGNKGAITIMNILAGMISTQDKIRFFQNTNTAKAWLSENNEN